VANISQGFTHKMAAKTSWHRYESKLRRCHPKCKPLTELRVACYVATYQQRGLASAGHGVVDVVVSTKPTLGDVAGDQSLQQISRHITASVIVLVAGSVSAS